MRVVVQIGYMKSMNRKRVGQLLRAYVNDSELSWSDKNGKYLTSRAESLRGLLWYLCELDLNEEDVIRIEAKTAIAGVGTDEPRTFESLYYVDKNMPVREIFVPGVGMKGYPILKGRILEIGSVSEADKRKSEIDHFLRDGF